MMLWWDERAVKPHAASPPPSTSGNAAAEAGEERKQKQKQKKAKKKAPPFSPQEKPKPNPKPRASKVPGPPATADQSGSLKRLLKRQQEVLDKITKLELFHRQREVLDSIASLEDRLNNGGGGGGGEACDPIQRPQQNTPPEDASETHKKIHSELAEKSIGGFEICRVPSDYYERDLEYRRQCLQGLSVDHLCKSMVMENTKDERQFPEGLPASEEDFWNSKYFMVIVQYVSRLNAEKIRDYIYDMRKGKTAKKKIKMRLAPAEVSYAITGYDHNAVTPIATKKKIPLIISHRIAELEPDFFWLGAGEVLLKVGFSAAKFADVYGAHVVNCTYDN